MSYSIFIHIENSSNIDDITARSNSVIDDYFEKLKVVFPNEIFPIKPSKTVLAQGNELAYTGSYSRKDIIGFNIWDMNFSNMTLIYNLLINLSLKHGRKINLNGCEVPFIVFDGEEIQYILNSDIASGVHSSTPLLGDMTSNQDNSIILLDAEGHYSLKWSKTNLKSMPCKIGYVLEFLFKKTIIKQQELERKLDSFTKNYFSKYSNLHINELKNNK